MKQSEPDVKQSEPDARQSEPVAVVDCGTNTTRLLITAAQPAQSGPAETHAETQAETQGETRTEANAELVRIERITGLGRGSRSHDPGAQAGILQPDAIERVLTALDEFAELIATHEVARVRAVATSAAREAPNAQDFLAAATSRLGHDVELLSAQDEARYSFSGATTELATTDLAIAAAPTTTTAPVAEKNLLVIDIGGGSTEFAIGKPAQLSDWRSLPLGSVRFSEQYLTSDPPAPEELSAAISVARQHLDDIDRELPQIRNVDQLIGVAGTITTMAAVELGLTQYDPAAINRFQLTRAAAEDVFRTLATESLADRVHNPGLAAARAPVIVGGCCILVAIMRHWKFEQCQVSHRDLLDGIAADLLGFHPLG